MKKILTIAIALLITATMFAKDDKSYHFQRAEEEYRQENYDKALLFLQEGLEKDAKDGYCWAMMAEIYSWRAYGRYGEALAAAEQALKLLPKKDTEWRCFIQIIQAEVYFKIGDYHSSIDAYKQALTIQPKNKNAIAELADVYRVIKDYEQSNLWYNKIIEIDPSEQYVYSQIAHNAIDMGDWEMADKMIHLSLTLNDDDNSEGYFAASRLAFLRHDYADAVNHWMHAINAQGDLTAYGLQDSLLVYARPLLLAAYKQATLTTPADITNWVHLAYQYWLDNDRINAIRSARKAAQIDERCIYTKAYFSQFLELEETDDLWLQTINEYDSTCYYERALYRLDHLQRYEDAINDFNHARAIAPDKHNYLRLIGRTYIYLEQYDLALAYTDSALAICEGDMYATTLSNRGEIYELLGNRQAAEADYQMAYEMPEADAMTHSFAAAHTHHLTEMQTYIDSLKSHAPDAEKMETIAQLYAIAEMADSAITYLNHSFAYGMRETNRIRHFFRYRSLQNDPRFIDLCQRMEQAKQAEIEQLQAPESGKQTAERVVTEIPFTRQGGVNRVKCTINSLPLYFVFDTGASDVTISAVEANFMLRNGYLTDADFMGKQNYVTATGEIHEGTIINLREVRIGDIVLHDIKASVITSQTAPLLLGQTVFRRFGNMEVDNAASIIRFIQ